MTKDIDSLKIYVSGIKFFMKLNDIIKLENFDLDYILIDEKLHENILVYNISYKTLVA